MTDIKALVVEFETEKIADSDFLSVAKIKDLEWQCVIRTDDFPVKKAIYIPLDSLLDTGRPEFAFLNKDGVLKDGKPKPHKMKTIRLRKVLSQGMLLPCPADAKVGDDFTEALGITRWEPPVPKNLSGGQTRQPGAFDKYTSIENHKNYPRVFIEGEDVRVTLKCHGSNHRCGFINDGIVNNGNLYVRLINFIKFIWAFITRKKIEQDPFKHLNFYVGSHNTARDPNSDNDYSLMAQKVGARDKLKPLVKESGAKHHFIVYGELYGKGVQTLTYDAGEGKKLRLFDVKIDHVFQPFEYVEKVAATLGIETVPVLYRGPYSLAKVMEFRDGKDPLGDHVREGVVVTAEPERHDRKIGRAIVKFISDDYLEMANKKGWSDGH